MGSRNRRQGVSPKNLGEEKEPRIAAKVRLKINHQGKEFSLIGADPPVNGKFLYEGVKVGF